jgi:hypothetical protein
LDASHQSASRYIETLEVEGVLREITDRARNSVYRADEVLQFVEELLNQMDGLPREKIPSCASSTDQ